MPRDPELNKARNETVRKMFEDMRAKRNEFGELVMHPESIIGTLSRKYFISKRRVEDIIYKRECY